MSTTTTPSEPYDSAAAAVEALQRGWQAVPIRDGGKRPFGSSWTHTRWNDADEARQAFKAYQASGAHGVGLLLGDPSGGLVDVDLDHPKSLRLRDHFLPPSAMATGRSGRPKSHRWYIIKDGPAPATRRYKMPDGNVSVELRSTGAQTVIPPSTWYPKEWDGSAETTQTYRWEGKPWGGAEGPAVVDGRKLAVQVALLGMVSVLIDNWPTRGGRHDAYLALAGGLLRFGHQGVHPFWEKNLAVVIEAMADATHDDDGGAARVAEVMGTTVGRLRDGGKAMGFPKLAEMIGVDHAELVRRMAREVESLSGFTGQPVTRVAPPGTEQSEDEEPSALDSTLPPEVRNPMEERISSWAAVDLEPYLAGEVVLPEPSVLVRTDGKGLFYPGRVNMLFGLSEAAKSWMALKTGLQEMDKGERFLFIDFEDGPEGTLSRMIAMGAGADDLANQFRYVHPEGPLADMQRYRFGHQPTVDGTASAGVFRALLDSFDPTIIVADGMTVLYGLHGHDTNEATGTEVITGWLKSLCRNGRTTVIVIDHTGKGGGAGSSPIGAHHKVAMVQGTALRVDAIQRPMPGAVGLVQLVVFKDRPGAVRAISTKANEQVAGLVTIDSTEPGITKITIDPANPDDVVIGNSAGMDAQLERLAKVDEISDQVLALFGGDLDAKVTTSQAMDSTGLSRDDVYEAWRVLTERGVVLAMGKNRWAHYVLNPPTSGD